MDTGILICYPHAMTEIRTVPLLSKSQLGTWASFAQSLSFEKFLLLQGGGPLQDVSILPLAETLDKILLPLTVEILAELWSGIKQRWNEEFAHQTFEKLFHLRQRKWLRSNSQTLELFLTAPDSFKLWISERQLSFSELSPLQLFTSLSPHEEFFNYFAQLKLTRQQGAKAIEWLSEWYHMQPAHQEKSPWTLILPLTEAQSNMQSTAGEQWLENLRSLRFPNTKAQDQKISSDLLARPWPQFAQVQQLRRGDTSGAELRLFFTSSVDFSTKIAKLNLLAEIWKNEKETQSHTSEKGINA